MVPERNKLRLRSFQRKYWKQCKECIENIQRLWINYWLLQTQYKENVFLIGFYFSLFQFSYIEIYIQVDQDQQIIWTYAILCSHFYFIFIIWNILYICYNEFYYQNKIDSQRLILAILYTNKRAKLIQYNNLLMLSTKTQTLNGKLKNPFASNQNSYAGFTSEFRQYKSTFQQNLQLLKRRFTHEDSNKIKDLLDEFDNNMEMVAQILLESQDKQQMVGEKSTPKKSALEDENRLLKNAIARLYKRLINQQKQLESLKTSQQRTRRQNQDLKLQNRLLLEREFGNNSFVEARDVY